MLFRSLGAPPPPPPANVPALKESGEDGAPPSSVRERLEQHRKNPVCASCHSRMDPLGFALESFNGVGKWRTTDANAPIDATGVLPDGTAFNGPVEFRSALLARPQEFTRTVVERLMIYALGRGIEPFDQPAIRAIVKRAEADNYRWSSIVIGIVQSVPFQMRNTPVHQESGTKRAALESAGR